MGRPPSISVIIPFYNEVPYIRQAVQSCLIPSGGVEVLIVNDNPALFPAESFAEFGFPDCVRVISHDVNRGLQAARNTGIRAARGDYIAFLDADDYFLTEGLADCLRFAVTQGADITHYNTLVRRQGRYSARTFIWDRVRYSADTVQHGDAAKIYGMNSMSTWASMYRAAFLRENALWGDEAQRKFEDRLFVVRTMLRATSVANFPHSIRVWRRRANSITTAVPDAEALNLKAAMFAKVIDEILASAQSRDVIEAFLVNDVSLFLSQLFTGGTEDAYRTLYIWDGPELDEARRRIGSAVAKIDADALVGRIQADLGTRLRTLKRRKAPRLSVSATASLMRAIVAADRAAVVKMIGAIRDQTPVPPLSVPDPDGQVDYIVHLGAHKTGTTAIQTALDEAREDLRRQGVLFPATGFGGLEGFVSVKQGGLPGHDALRHALMLGDGAVLGQLSAEIARSGCRTVILSAENLLSPLYGAGNASAFSAFAKAMSRLPRRRSIRFVLYLREPVSWMDSYFREQLAGGNRTALLASGPDEFALGNMDFVDFATLVDQLARISGQRILLANFERAKRGDLVQGFLDLSMGEDAPRLPKTAAERSLQRYPGISDAQATVLAMIKPMVRDRELYKSVAREFLARSGPEGKRSILFHPSIQQAIRRTFASRNQPLLSELEDAQLLTPPVTTANSREGVVIPSEHIETINEIFRRPYLIDRRLQHHDRIALFGAEQSVMRGLRAPLVNLAKAVLWMKRIV